jgi:thimet oligopeptidase
VDAIVRQTMVEYLPYQAPAAEIHPEASFSHLQGYGAAYYTYLWSAVIAKDFEREFGGDLFNRQVAMRYRRTVLEGGRSAPAARLVEDFLGRPFSVKPWGEWVTNTR